MGKQTGSKNKAVLLRKNGEEGDGISVYLKCVRGALLFIVSYFLSFLLMLSKACTHVSSSVYKNFIQLKSV